MAQENQSNYFVHNLLRARDWQHRPEFDEVCKWWRDGGLGVCALIGMGGAGKTAIAERFLNALLDVMNSSADKADQVHPPLPRPHGVFVYSFYDDDKPENFFRRLQMWLENTPRLETVLAVGQLLFLIQQRRGLIILDGLERVQESGARGGFGKLTSPSLRELLNHIAAGLVPEWSVLTTSRFPLADLRDSQPRYFQRIPVEEIDLETGVKLLRIRGVQGANAQLAGIVEHCGRHALTVDLAGGYIKEYGKGDPTTTLNLGTAEELKAEVDDEPDDDKRAVLIQSRRFARIAQRYRDAMLENDEASLALLERICLFRLGVACETLADIFTGPEAEKVSGKSLASLSAEQLQRKLDWLVKMRIIERSENRTLMLHTKPHFKIHPAVRDGFLAGIGREIATVAHEAVRHGLEVSLQSVPGTKSPTSARELDLLEEIMYHALMAGDSASAFNIYQDRIGGAAHLCWKLADYERGIRICKVFLF
ncbi:MAG: hypothetical protein N2C14_28865, partial [Planctomycetales bacterium]